MRKSSLRSIWSPRKTKLVVPALALLVFSQSSFGAPALPKITKLKCAFSAPGATEKDGNVLADFRMTYQGEFPDGASAFLEVGSQKFPLKISAVTHKLEARKIPLAGQKSLPVMHLSLGSSNASQRFASINPSRTQCPNLFLAALDSKSKGSERAIASSPENKPNSDQVKAEKETKRLKSRRVNRGP